MATASQTRLEELRELRTSVGNVRLPARQRLEDIFKRAERLLNAKCLFRRLVFLDRRSRFRRTLEIHPVQTPAPLLVQNLVFSCEHVSIRC